MENAENASLNFGQLPESLLRWLFLTENHLFQICENGKEWTNQELQAAKKCLKLRNKYNFTEQPPLPEKVYLQPDKENWKLNQDTHGIIQTGMTVKEKAEREKYYEQMDSVRNGKTQD